MEKSFYAFIIGNYSLCGEKKEEPLANNMLLLILEPSIYCRENALFALYNSRNTELVVKALVLMNRHHIIHSRKLITDGLLTFTGNKEGLAEELWKNRNFFHPHYQIAVIDYIRMVSNRFIDDWEFAAISASALENYPGEKAIKALIRGIKSDNWYVRNNSADSLLKITGKERQQKILNEMTDSFGRDMLEYKMESLKKRQKLQKNGKRRGTKNDGCN